MSDVMMLSQNLKENKIEYPVFISEKLDGVPGIYTITNDGIEVVSRQNKPILSTSHIKEQLSLLNLPVGTTIIGEHYIPDKPFKYISGKVRQHTQCEELYLAVFDMFIDENTTFEKRWNNLTEYLFKSETLLLLQDDKLNKLVIIPQIKCNNKNDVILTKLNLLKVADKSGRKVEGFMYRNASGVYEYIRSWNCMKEVLDTTIDLEVFGMLVAKDKDGNSLDMVGTLKCRDSKGNIYNVSPGKSDHTTRKIWWSRPEEILEKIIVVKYKPDDTYTEGLRQPTFQHIHEDKINPD